MMRITTPLLLTGTAVNYPGDPLLWTNTEIDGDTLIGDYHGELYEADGVTKLFNWSAYIKPKRSFGKVITTLAFRGRVGEAARVAINLKTQVDPTWADNDPRRQLAAALEDYKSEVLSATFIQLNRPDLLSKLVQLAAMGFPLADTPANIVGADVGSVELPKEIREQHGLPAIPTEQELSLNGGRGWLSPDDMS